MSGYSIKLTLWGATAEGFDGSDFPVMAFKAVRVGDFGGKSLSTMSGTTILTNPDMREAHELRGWYDSIGVNSKPVSLSTGGGGGNFDQKKTIAQVRDEGLGQSETKPDFFTLKAFVLMIPHENNISYPSCPNPECGKKINEEAANQWQCDHCRNVYSNCIQK